MKTGDKIVCIDDSEMIDDLTIGKSYTILEYGKLQENELKNEFFIIMMGNKNPGCFHPSRFISLKQYRKLKLEKIENEKR